MMAVSGLESAFDPFDGLGTHLGQLGCGSGQSNQNNTNANSDQQQQDFSLSNKLLIKNINFCFKFSSRTISNGSS